MTFLISSWRRTLLLIFILALLTRGIFISLQQDGFYFPDSLSYSRTAVNLVEQGEFGAQFGRAPGYPVFIAGVYALFGESIFAVRLLESVMGAFLAVIIAVVGRRAGGDLSGAFAGLIWAIYPMGVFIAGLVYPAGLAAMFLACGVWCVMPVRAEEFSVKGVFGGGICLGLAALVIPVTLLTILVVAAWNFYWAGKSRALLASTLLLGAALVVAPWIIRQYLVLGKLVPIQANVDRHSPRMLTGDNLDEKGSDKGSRVNLFAAHFGRQFMRFWELYPNRIKMDRPGRRENWNGKDPRVVPSTIYRPTSLINTVSILSTGPVFLFAILGTAAMWRRRESRFHLSLFWAMALSYAIGYAVFVGRIRYRIPVEPYIIIVGAYGIALTWQSWSRRYARAHSEDRSFGMAPRYQHIRSKGNCISEEEANP